MSRSSKRRGNDRSRTRDRSRSPILSQVEIVGRNILELQEKLVKQNQKVAEQARRLEHSYGIGMDSPNRSYSRSPRRENYMSPIRIGVSMSMESADTSSPIRIGSPGPYENNRSPPIYINDSPGYDHIRSRPRSEVVEHVQYEAPAHFDDFDHRPPPWYNDSVDVRVDEMPRWPMERSPSPIRNQMQIPSPSFKPIWRNQEEVRIEPIPVFPMAGKEEERRERRKRKTSPSSRVRSDKSQSKRVDSKRTGSKRNDSSSESSEMTSRHEKARLQMEMLARQADLADQDADAARPSAKEEAKKREEQERMAQQHIAEIKRKVLQEEREERRREADERRNAEIRRAQQRKEKEEERRRSNRRDEDRRKSSSTVSSSSHPSSSNTNSTFYGDEYFLKFLEPAIGKIVCVANRSETRSKTMNSRDSLSRRNSDSTVYKAMCHVVNIPKELIEVVCERPNKGDAYKDAVSKYVTKLVELGVITKEVRVLLGNKEAKFLAELVEPLCNDIAIFGTQISVTESRDMKSKFVSFCKEKSAEFWNTIENLESLSKFLTKQDRTVRDSTQKQKKKHHSDDVSRSFDNRSGHSRDSPRDRKNADDNRKRTRSPSPANKSSLESLFASHQLDAVNGAVRNAVPSSFPPIASINNYMVQGVNNTPLLPMPTYSQPYSMPNTYPPQQFFNQAPAPLCQPLMPTYTMTPSLMSIPTAFPYQQNHHQQSGIPPLLQPSNPLGIQLQPQQQQQLRPVPLLQQVIPKPKTMVPDEDIDLMDEIFN